MIQKLILCLIVFFGDSGQATSISSSLIERLPDNLHANQLFDQTTQTIGGLTNNQIISMLSRPNVDELRQKGVEREAFNKGLPFNKGLRNLFQDLKAYADQPIKEADSDCVVLDVYNMLSISLLNHHKEVGGLARARGNCFSEDPRETMVNVLLELQTSLKKVNDPKHTITEEFQKSCGMWGDPNDQGFSTVTALDRLATLIQNMPLIRDRFANLQLRALEEESLDQSKFINHNVALDEFNTLWNRFDSNNVLLTFKSMWEKSYSDTKLKLINYFENIDDFQKKGADFIRRLTLFKQSWSNSLHAKLTEKMKRINKDSIAQHLANLKQFNDFVIKYLDSMIQGQGGKAISHHSTSSSTSSSSINQLTDRTTKGGTGGRVKKSSKARRGKTSKRRKQTQRRGKRQYRSKTTKRFSKRKGQT